MNTIHANDNIKVSISDESGKTVFNFQGTGFHNNAEAIATAYAHMMGKDAEVIMHAGESLEDDPSFFHYYANPERGANDIENYSFTITNLSKDTSARYRVNAGGHVHIID